jgi:hypothetical protein
MKASIEILRDADELKWIFPEPLSREDRKTLMEAQAKLTGTQFDYWSEKK